MIRAIRHKIPASDSTLIRLGVLVGLLVGLLGIGYMTPSVPPELVLMAVVAPPVVLLALSRLEYGVLEIILTAAFVRFTLPTGTASRIVASLVMTVVFIVLWLAKMLVINRKLHLKSSITNVPLLAFLLTMAVSYVWSTAFRDPLVVVWATWPVVQLGGLAVMILLPGAFLLTANVMSEVRWLKLLCWLMVFIGGLVLAAYVVGTDLDFVNTGGLFSLWFVSLTYAQGLFNKKLPIWLRLGLFGSAGLWVYIYFVTRVSWLSGWLPTFAAMATISLFKSKKLFLVLALLVVLYMGLNWTYYANTVLAEESEESGVTRLAAWKVNWQVTGKHILFGTGPAGYAAYYMSYFPNEGMATHNNFLDVLSQSGIVGLFFCLWFFGALGWSAYRLRRRLKGTGDFSEALSNATLAGWVGCLIAMGLGDWMFPFVYTQTIAGFDYAVYSWVLLGATVALSNIHAQGEATDADGG